MHSAILSKNIVKFFFCDKLSKNFFFLKKQKMLSIFMYNNEQLYELANIKFKKIFNNIELLTLHNRKYKFFKESKVIPSYNTKLYFIKYNGWVILTFRIYTPISTVFLRNYKSPKLHIYSFYSNYWKYFYINILKNKFSLKNKCSLVDSIF